MGSTVILPNGMKIRHHRPFTHVIAQGPCERNAFLAMSAEVVEMRTAEAAVLQHVAERGEVVRDLNGAWLLGYEDYRIAHFGRDEVNSFFYVPGSPDTEPEPRLGALRDILVNHTEHAIWSLEEEARETRDIADLVEKGSPTAAFILGDWEVVKWCKTADAAHEALPAYESRRDWGAETRIIPTVCIRVLKLEEAP